MSQENIAQSAESGQLVVVLGAGASMSLMPKSRRGLSWTELVNSALLYCNDRKLITDSQLARQTEALASDDIDELLGVAEFAGRKLGAPTDANYGRWMRSTFESWTADRCAMANALRAIASRGILISTLNFDTVAESVVHLPAINFVNTQSVLEWCRKEREGILHLHGTWTDPASCVFGIRDYHAAVNDQARDLVQRSLSSLNRLLFVGCGDTFTDPNFSGLISWLREHVGAGAPQHYALVRADEVSRRMGDPTWRGFVEPLGYGDSYSDLPRFLLDCFPTRPIPNTAAARAKASANRGSQAIEAYRQFLLRDCGEMTIEGMRADMDTAQRKFDLEKLFVPLEIQRFEPVIPLDDVDRQIKLQEWREDQGKPLDFSVGFAKSRRMALLALPGGGKTMLLKRLAVAYSNPARREASSDNLPNLDLIPLMIRCREWKDHIRRPFQTLFQEMARITGEQKLEGLAVALEKPLKAGNVLLLIDGLDEIHDDGDRSVFVENLEKFLDTYPKVRLVVSSREAGFELVAPCLGRFCEKYKIAPLNEDAIRTLNAHWHRLMSGVAPDALAEAETVAKALLTRGPIRFLAENPLLLTMLLVVKHAAGRLPSDRASLYERAVEVLLDTWNIKGHEPLNSKEAVPQLASLALELMRRGQQTATEREILEILDTARERLPQIGRYARDAPHEFLKRVELRSSLMLQGGHTNVDGKAVPFYQFRHLTFQEYLAALAVVEGYVLDPGGPHSIVSTLGENLLSDEWKEVVPMTAVLARSRAEPLLEALTVLAEADAESRPNKGDRPLEPRGISAPRAAVLLRQAMTEEAIFASSVLVRAARIIVYFFGGDSSSNWRALGVGPYGPDLRVAALSNYMQGNFVSKSFARMALASLESYGRPQDYWRSEQSIEDTLVALADEREEVRVQAIAAIGGGYFRLRNEAVTALSTRTYDALEATLFDESPHVWFIGVWGWGFWRHLASQRDQAAPVPPAKTLVRLAELYYEGLIGSQYPIGFIMTELKGIPRNNYGLAENRGLVSAVDQVVQKMLNGESTSTEVRQASVRLAWLMPESFSDDILRELVLRSKNSDMEMQKIVDIAEYFGVDFGKEGIGKIGKSRRGIKESGIVPL